MSTETIKNRSGVWYLLPIFLAIIGGVITYFVVKEDDPKKAKNCLYLGIILTGIGIGFTIISGVILTSEMENFDYATSSEISFSDESQINHLAEDVEYEYNVFGLKTNYIHVIDEQGNPATHVDMNSEYAIVSEIQNKDDFEKNISYSISIRSEGGPGDEFENLFEHEMHAQTTIPANGMMYIDNGGIIMTEPGIYDIEIWLEDIDTRNQIYDELQRNSNGEYPQPFWRMFYLE